MLKSKVSRKSFISGFCCILAAVAFTGRKASAVEASDGAERYPKRREVAPPAAGGIRAVFTVNPGQTIQAAVNRAQPGDRIEVMPGVYHESVLVDIDNIELAGIVVDGDRPLFDGENKLNDAVLGSGHNFTISGFAIKNYKGNGVVVNKAMNCTFRDLVAQNTGKYALYPIECNGVRVENCVASGAWDAAIYAGQCKNVVIQGCEAFHSTIGIEAENSINVLFANNSAHHNSLGLLVVLLPNLPSKTAENAKLINNRVWDNNYPNLSPPGNIVNLVQPGVGVAINAADRTEVTRNDITDHASYGIAVYSLTDALPESTKLDVEPNPDGNVIHDNVLARNGEDPEKIGEKFKKRGVSGGDLYWSGKGVGNLWKEATTRTTPAQLPALVGGANAGGI